MPFAMIAVVLLVLAGIYGAVAAGVERSQDNMDDMHDELDSVGSAAEAVRGRLEKGIGEIILDMSREAATGTLDERFDKFDVRLAEWMNFQFPMRESGAVVTVLAHDIELGVGTLRASSDNDDLMGGVMPSCFRADGSVTMNISTSSGNVIRGSYISADSMSALPLLLENASLFEASITGPWSLITELMTYQLTSLAQYRVMSGYGAMSEHGAMGTDSIITEGDVDLAYRVALSIAEITYLHTTADDHIGLDLRDGVDAAELLAFRDGVIEVDLGAVMAQTLIGIADDLILGWMDYLMLTKLLDIFETVADTFKNAWNWLVKAVTGEESETAQKYLSATMSDHGISESEYRYLLNGVKGMIDIPSVSHEAADPGDEMIIIPASSVTFDYPNVDILDWSGWNGFMSSYRAEHNEIRDSLRSVINSIAIEIAGTYGLGVIRMECDPYDDKDLMTSLTDAVTYALGSQKAAVEGRIESAIRSGKVIDTLYATIYDHMVMNRSSLFGADALKNSIRSAVKTDVTGYVEREYGVPLDPSVIDSMVDEVMLSDDVVNVLEEYEHLVDSRLSLFGDILNNIEKNTRSIFKDAIALIVRFGMDSLGLYPLLEAKMIGLVREMAEMAALSPLSGVYDLPDTDPFVLEGSDGTTVKEYVSFDRDISLDITVVSPTDNDENVHYVGFLEDREASYSSLFRIFVTADVRYAAGSSSSLMVMLGTYDAAVSGASHSKFDIAVAVMSGWALAGVHYEPSRTIVDDVVDLFLRLIEPLLEPLFTLMNLAKSVLDLMTNAIMRVAQFVSDLLMKLYEIIMAPIELFGQLVSNILGKIFDDIVGTIMLKLGSQTFGISLYGMTLEIVTDIVGELQKGTSTTKIMLTLPIFGVTLSASLEIKKDKTKNFFFSGGISAVADTWFLDVNIDPLMKVRKHMVEINGTFRGTDIYAVMPQVVQYDELELRLSDIPGVGDLLSNIPLPVPGMKGSIDAGFELKYNSPYVYGVVINEFESNPSGTDTGSEWTELYNSTVSSVDLEGYMLTTLTSPGKIYTLHGITLAPWERVVIKLPGQFLNNSKESVQLLDAEGRMIDVTPLKNDAKDDDTTWQRETDASAKWVFKKNSKESPNGGSIGKISLGGNPVRAAIMQCVTAAATQAFSEMNSKILGPDGVAQFLKRIIELTIEKAIDMIAGCVVSASVFIEIAVSDVTGSIHSGIRFSLMIDGDFVRDGLNWAVGQIKAMMGSIDNPAGMTPRQIISDDVYFQTMIFAKVTTPRVLGSVLGGRDGVTAGLVIGCNITALCNLLGRPGGTWRVNIGLVLENVPSYVVPSVFNVDSDKETDIWLFRMTLERSKG